jgi:hypothetical protein
MLFLEPEEIMNTLIQSTRYDAVFSQKKPIQSAFFLGKSSEKLLEP